MLVIRVIVTSITLTLTLLELMQGGVGAYQLYSLLTNKTIEDIAALKKNSLSERIFKNLILATLFIVCTAQSLIEWERRKLKLQKVKIKLMNSDQDDKTFTNAKSKIAWEKRR